MPERFPISSPFRAAVILRKAAVWLALVAVLVAAPGLAQQQPGSSLLAALEPLKLSLDEIETTINRDGLGSEALIDLRSRIAPIREQLRQRIGVLEPGLTQVDMRLKELGPAPGKDAPAEDAAIAAEREQMLRRSAEFDAGLRQARLLALRADQLLERVNDQRRVIFTRELFERSPSVLDPFFWVEFGAALPQEARSVGFLLQSWWSYAHDRGGYSRMVAAGILIVVLAVVAWRFGPWRRLRAGSACATLSRFDKVVASMRVLAETASPPPLTLLLILHTLDAFALMPARIMEIGNGLVIASFIAMLGGGIGAALLAPIDRERRLIAVDDATARHLCSQLAWATRALGAAIFLNILHKEIVAPVLVTVGTSAVLALVVAGLILRLLLRVPEAEARQPQSTIRWIRMIGWLAASVMAVALATGYIGFAAFVAGRLLSIIVVTGALYLLMVLIDAAFSEVLAADTPRARKIAANLGLSIRNLELVGSLLSAVFRLLLLLVAIFLAVGPWGILAADVFGAMRGAVFGFRVGDITISLTAIVGAITVLLIGLLLTRGAQQWLQGRLLPRTGLDPSLQLSVGTIFGYVGFIAVIALSLAELGIDLQKVALVAGALSVGIGFGLQSIVSNFISGLILLAERPIRVGDTIVVKGEEGYVRRISVRATEIETFERASVIIPNSELITGVVKNWTHANTTGRITIKVGTPYDCDPDQVRDLLMACACDHPQVLQTPAPRVLLMAFGDSALEFELRCVVANVDYGLVVKSDLHFAILHRLRKAGIEIPVPTFGVQVQELSTVENIRYATKARKTSLS